MEYINPALRAKINTVARELREKGVQRDISAALMECMRIHDEQRTDAARRAVSVMARATALLGAAILANYSDQTT